jgi:AcrR family transcriptional regulator
MVRRSDPPQPQVRPAPQAALDPPADSHGSAAPLPPDQSDPPAVSGSAAASDSAASPGPSDRRGRRGRPRSDSTDRRILDAARRILAEESFSDLRIEHVAARAGVGKATIYRRWRSKEELAQAVLSELAGPHIAIAATGDTREEMLLAVVNPMRAITDSPFGEVIRSLLSQIATNPLLGDPFRATVVEARRSETEQVIERGIARGDLRPDVDPHLATELLVGPVYFRVMFGGTLDQAFAEAVVDHVLRGYAGPGGQQRAREPSG